ncbi:MAG: lactonase family protein [Acidobacteria bacterium]|nr:lactonase family protein [Acidobacteriota bacterium]
MAPETSRREFLALSGAALAAASLGAYQSSPSRLYAYVGRRTKGPGFGVGGGGGVTVFSVNMTDGSLTEVSQTGPEHDDLNCDGMCISADARFLYAVIQTPSFGRPGGGGGISAFAIDRENGSLRHLNTLPSMGANPVGVIIDKTNARVLVANHGAVAFVSTVTKRNGVPVVDTVTDDATIALFPVKPDGSLEPASDVHVFARRPPTESGRAAAAHQVIFDRTQRWAIASDNGYDHLYVYPFNPGSRTLEGKAFATPPGKAPRHFALHPRAPYFFITNEREASVSSFHFDSNTGEVRAVQTSATIPQGYSGPNVSPSNIQIHPNGKFIYAANRGDNSVAIFAIDEGSGRMSPVSTVTCGGRGPREMNFEPSGRYFYVCNQQSSDVTTFVADGNTGLLTQGPKVEVAQAGVIHFAVL